jgi:hypothetical protein
VTLDMYWQAIPGAEERVADQAGEIFPNPKIRNLPRISPKRGLRKLAKAEPNSARGPMLG